MSTHTQSLQRWIVILGTTLLLLGAAMAYLLWRDSQHLQQASFSTNSVTQIRILREGFDDIHVSKTAQTWQIESPCTIAVNTQRLEPLLGALASGAHQYNANEVDLEAAGLLTPQAIVFINETEHRIGNTDLSGERRYRQSANQVGFIPEWVLSLINGGVSAFAELQVLPDSIASLLVKDVAGVETLIALPEDIQQWQNLSAQQIVVWPTDDFDNVEPALELIATTQTDEVSAYSVYHTDRYTAITGEAENCAFVIPLDTLPD